MKDIKGYEGHYAITSCGKVWSCKRQRFLKPFQNSCGYFHIDLCKNGVRKRYFVHRLVAEAFLPNPNNLPEVNHLDENKAHNYLNNLEWIDHASNCAYSARNK